VYCSKCGTQNDDQANFCKSCGASLKPEVVITANETIPVTVMPPVPPVEYAGFWRRAAAYLIDAIIWGVVSTIAGIAGGIRSFTENKTAVNIIIIIYVAYFILLWLYFAIMESSSRQATVGKMAMGIKVTNMNGGRISFANATGRYFARMISAMILYIGFFMIAFTARKQGLHDIMANTLVVQK